MEKLLATINKSNKLDQLEKGLLMQAVSVKGNDGKWVAFNEKFIGVIESLRLKGLITLDLENDCFCVESLDIVDTKLKQVVSF